MGTGATATQCGVQTDNRNYDVASTNIGYFGAFATGYTTDLKVDIGATLIDPNSTTIPVPTSPLTANANTRMLYNANTAGTFLVDSSGYQTLDTNFGVTFSSDSPY